MWPSFLAPATGCRAEIRLHSQLRHPNIIQLYAAFEDDNYVFMVTEFAAGGWMGCAAAWLVVGGRWQRTNVVAAAAGRLWALGCIGAGMQLCLLPVLPTQHALPCTPSLTPRRRPV